MSTILDAVPAGAFLAKGQAEAARDIIGLDLGQAQDYSALSLVERVLEPTGRFVDTGRKQLMQYHRKPPEMVPVVEPETRPRLNVTDLTRFPLQTDYVVMAKTVHAAVDALRAGYRDGQPAPILVIDHTGVGRGVFDIFRHERLGVPLIGITIQSGHTARRHPDRPWEWSVPKKDLVSALQVAVQADRLRVAPALALAKQFTKEMQAFRMKITAAANVTYEAWREGDHDDLVLSVAMACWMAERLSSEGGVY
jgi:hypothetical protein